MTRIVVLSDEPDGEFRVRESRELFEVPEFRLCYTCKNCGLESTLPVGKPDKPFDWPACKCGSKPVVLFDDDVKEERYAGTGDAVSVALLFHSELCYLIDRYKLPLKFVLTKVGTQ